MFYESRKNCRFKKLDAPRKIDFTYISDPGHIAYFSGYESEPHERVLALFYRCGRPIILFTPALEDAERVVGLIRLWLFEMAKSLGKNCGFIK